MVKRYNRLLVAIHVVGDAVLGMAAFLLALGIYGLIRRRTLIGMLISGELIFAAASLNLMAFNRFTAPDPAVGQIFVLFIMGLAAAEVAAANSSSCFRRTGSSSLRSSA